MPPRHLRTTLNAANAPGWLRALAEMPILAGLSPRDWALIEHGVTPHDLAAGDVFLREEADTSGLFLLVRGEVAVHRDGRLVTLIRAPHALGLLALIDGGVRSATLAAFAPSLVVQVPRALFDHLRATSPAFSNNLTVALATELRRMYTAQSEQLAHFDDFFEAPNAKLVPGPYVAEHIDMVLCVMQGDPVQLARLLPDGLRPFPGLDGKFLLTFNFFRGVRSESPIARGKTFAYSETCPFIPCLGPRLQPAVFTPELYPDNLLAIALGREAYGFPKRFGRTTEGERTIDLSVGGGLTLRAAWESARTVDAGTWANHVAALWTGGVGLPALLQPVLTTLLDTVDGTRLAKLRPAVPVFVHKQILDERTETERVFDVDSLIEIPFQIQHLGDYRVLDGASVRYLDDRYFLPGTCVGAARLRLGFRFGRGREWRDYLADAGSTPLSRLWRRVKEDS